ncbi:MAG: zinc ribbon domain-containing protein [Firmicutes bacterium]|nr:zinc ribbon domain-containing protein [Bacillota bacterium]
MDNRNRPQLSPCPYCTETTRKDDRFCRHCGAELRLAGVGTVGRLVYNVGIVAGAALVALFIYRTMATTPIAVGPVNSLAASHKQATGKGHSVSAFAPATSYPSTPETKAGGWHKVKETYLGATITLTLPSKLEQRSLSHPGYWRWTSAGGRYGVLAEVKPEKSPAATQPLGTMVFGTPITAQANQISEQMIDIAWPQHGWLEVVMTVPSPDTGWLATIAQSVKIT